MNKKTGLTFRLPTEAEWEFAAMGGVQSKGFTYSGSDNPDDVAWYGDNASGTTHEVGTKAANELGIFDMCGNVDEWTLDRYAPHDGTAEIDPQNPAESGYSVSCRGGYYNSGVSGINIKHRGGVSYGNHYAYIGFRLAL